MSGGYGRFGSLSRVELERFFHLGGVPVVTAEKPTDMAGRQLIAGACRFGLR
ncbi:hypothetical protein [Nocardia brevicatena]|uniref:hypothetical protein n=1 Tax=Nocardia brevicatena TaxID=37327 RepID=UPI0012F8CAFF|nr:hypothetical protein [Nocardia brevicatena]